jgi:hypothetical protein
VGVQQVYPLLPQESPQAEPGCEIRFPAEFQRKNWETLLNGPAKKFTPGITGDQEPVTPVPHNPALGKNPVFLPSPT